jgi:hypothetical protein
MYPPIVASQRLGKNVTTETITHAIIEELLVASFSMLSVSYQRNVDSSSENLLLESRILKSAVVWDVTP